MKASVWGALGLAAAAWIVCVIGTSTFWSQGPVLSIFAVSLVQLADQLCDSVNVSWCKHSFCVLPSVPDRGVITDLAVRCRWLGDS